MKKTLSLIGSLFIAATSAQAQNLNDNIADYRPEMFQNCYAGQDIGALMNASNPLLLLGSVAYVGRVMTPRGAVDGWVREPMALPITVADSIDPDNTTCSIEFETTAGANFSVLGVSLTASRADVYRVNVRLISRQSLADVAEAGNQVKVWRATAYQGQFRSVMAATPASVADFFLFDNISIYLVQVERFRRRTGGLVAGIGLFSGGVNYDRDNQFRGTRLLVTGNPVHLPRTAYITPAPTAVASQAVAPPDAAASPAAANVAVQQSLQQVRNAARNE